MVSRFEFIVGMYIYMIVDSNKKTIVYRERKYSSFGHLSIKIVYDRRRV